MTPRALLGCALAGVATLAAPGRAQAVRDSAGIQIVENRSPSLPANRAWRVEPAPILSIGDQDSPMAGDSLYEFSLVMGVARLGDGRIAVGVQSTNTIRFFDASGKFVGSGGRRGRGPGELEQILKLVRLPGDTLLVLDVFDAEYFGPDGKWIRLGASRSKGAGSPISPMAAFDDQSFAGIDFNDATERPPVDGARVFALVRVSRDGLGRKALGTVPGRPFVPGAGRFPPQISFSPSPYLASDGRTLFFGYGALYEISARDSEGDVLRFIRRTHTPVPVTSALKSEHADYRRRLAVAANGGPLTPQRQAGLEQALASARYAETLPAFSGMIVDRGGNLWVRAYDTRETITVVRAGPGERMPSTPTPAFASSWDVFDPGGRWLCTVQMPERFTALDIGPDYVAGLARDDDDVEIVRVYRLVKP